MITGINPQGKQPAFKGFVKSAEDFLDNGTKSLWNNKQMQRAVKWGTESTVGANGKEVTNISKFNMGASTSQAALIGGLYALNGLNSKDMPEERKGYYVTNTLMTTAMGITGGFLLNKIFDPVKDYAKNVVLKAHPKKDSLSKGLELAINLVAFTLSLRYLAPVIATPLSKKLEQIMVKKNPEKETKPASVGLKENPFNAKWDKFLTIENKK